MRLSAMVDLVLKQVHQQAVALLNLDMRTSIEPHLAAQQGRGPRVANTDQTLVHGRLPVARNRSWKKVVLRAGMWSSLSERKTDVRPAPGRYRALS
jgi:hypothetical protein